MKTSQGLSGGLFVKGGGRKGLLVGPKKQPFPPIPLDDYP